MQSVMVDTMSAYMHSCLTFYIMFISTGNAQQRNASFSAENKFVKKLAHVSTTTTTTTNKAISGEEWKASLKEKPSLQPTFFVQEGRPYGKSSPFLVKVHDDNDYVLA